MEVLGLLENISLLLLGVLYGDPEACASEKGNRTVCRNTSHLVEIYFYTSREITLSRPRCTAFLLWYGKCHQLSDSPNICRWPGRGRGVCPALWRAQPCSHLLLGLPQGIAVDVDAERWRCFYHFDKCALFVFWLGNRNIFRLFGGENSHTIQTQQVPSNKTGSNQSCRNIQEYSSQMPSLGKFYRAHWEALSLDVLNFMKLYFFLTRGQ